MIAYRSGQTSSRRVNSVASLLSVSALGVALFLARPSVAATPDLDTIGQAYPETIRPLLETLCWDCHSTERQKGELDLERFASFADVRRDPSIWPKVADMLADGEMPPKNREQPDAGERDRLIEWIRDFLQAEALTRAGDPGLVLLRRLSNAEYTYTLRDLTGVDSLDPASVFPADGAAGEGFTNTGSALVMSPMLLTKYLDAGKEIANHAVLLPDGFRFSPHTSRSDWTNELLADIRALYAAFTDSTGGDNVNLQGVKFDTNQGGRLPLDAYLVAMLAERDAVTRGGKMLEDIAGERGLSAKYLARLWDTFENGSTRSPSLLLDEVRALWQEATVDDTGALLAKIAQWQQALWRFNSVGHIGRLNGPMSWMEAISPVVARHEMKLRPPDAPMGEDVVFYLTAGSAGDGAEHDVVVWERPRLVAPGRPDLLLRDVRAVARELAARREELVASVVACLDAAAQASAAEGLPHVDALARAHNVKAESLRAWLDFLGISDSGSVNVGTPITGKAESIADFDFVKGWVGDDALSVQANASDQHVRVPGNMGPHSVAVHPSPTRQVVIGWRSPEAGAFHIEGGVRRAHPECGNGAVWSLELRRGGARQKLVQGLIQWSDGAVVGPLEDVPIRAGDVLALVIDPRDGNHSCDLTAVDLTLRAGDREWNLSRDVSLDILASNPHADRYGNDNIWHFSSEPIGGGAGHLIPAGSLLARWQTTTDAKAKHQLAEELQRLLQTDGASLPADSPDTTLLKQLVSIGGPLLSAALRSIAAAPAGTVDTSDSPYGLEPSMFGTFPSRESSSPDDAIDPASLCVQAPSVIEVRLPAELVAGSEFVTTGTLHPQLGLEGSVQLAVLTTKPDDPSGLMPTDVTETTGKGTWTSTTHGVSFATPVIVAEKSDARRRFESAFDEFRELFPAALCYAKIVPVDEVITLTLFYREDDHLQRLMLDADQALQLDTLWDELHYVSQDALTLVDAFAQILEYASQDAEPAAFEPLRKPIHDNAEAFRQRLLASESRHLDALIAFAAKAYRRPITDAESEDLRALYASLREQEVPHDEAFRLCLARVFIAPAFLYKVEQPKAGAEQGPVTDWELASRLSYFLWSSQPDEPLRELAATGRLGDPDMIVAQAKRMLADAKTRRLAIEFACQWLHIYEFDQLDEKSERHFPTFAALRGAMYEESIRYFADFFQNNASVLSLIDADHTFLNEALARHYGIPDVTGVEWRRVDGVGEYARGGILTWATTLAKQSGASRTSPILRGNWLSEVVLGERLPRPPKDVPPLAETVPDGLTERQLIERHSSDPACMKCHARIDPFGFALEHFDAIGRFREKDAHGLEIDSRTTLPDGTAIDGLDDLRQYLLTTRRDAFVRQFCKKLLGYALGRSVQLSDEPVLSDMEAALEANDYRVFAAIETIIRSRPFREIRGLGMVYND